MDSDIEALRDWIGRTESAQDMITAAPLCGLAATLDRDDPPPRPGDPLPPGAHWLYTLPLHRQSQLGTDGHARRGGFLPPVPLPRRMWAGSQLAFHQPLYIGATVRRLSRIEDVQGKQGRSGALVFVRVRHEFHADDGLALVDTHDIVYRDRPRPGETAPPPTPAPTDAAWRRRVHPDPVLLFRYSALTFNGHRIHYDRDFCRTHEGYPGLVVHGPLLATLLLDGLRRAQPDAALARFAFRAVRPLFDTGPFEVCGAAPEAGRVRLWVCDASGALAMEAQADLRA